MKKKFALMLVICMAIAAMFCGCGSDNSESPYVGTWNCTEVSMEGMTLDPAMLGGDITLDLAADGTATLSFLGDSASGDWSEAENGVTLSDNGITEEVTLVAGEDGSLTLDYEGMTMVFVLATDAAGEADAEAEAETEE